MSAYRPTPQVPGLPLPRRHLELFVGLVYGAAVLVALVPARLLPLWKEATQYAPDARFGVSSAVAFVTAVVAAIAGARAVRGGRRAQLALALLPMWPVWVAVFLSSWRGWGVPTTPPGSVAQLGRHLATTDLLVAHGCSASALACGVGTVALLGAGASVDRREPARRRSDASGKTIVLGLLALVVGVLVSFLVAPVFLVLVVVPSFVVLTALAAVSRTNAPLVSRWEEPSETDAWVHAVLAGGILAALGFVLLAQARALEIEAGLVRDATRYAGLTASRVAVLAHALRQARVSDRIAVALGLVALAVVVPAAVAGLRQESRRRWPRGKVAIGAASAALVLAVVLSRGRARVLRDIDLSSTGFADEAAVRSGLDLPRLGDAVTRPSPVHGRPFHILVRVDAAGGTEATRVRPNPFAVPDDREGASDVVLYADRRARWADVARGIEEGVGLTWEDEPGHYLPGLEIRALPEGDTDRTPAGVLAPLLGPDAVSLPVALERTAFGTHLRPDDDETFGEITDRIAQARAMGRPATLILPPRAR